jgi:hypothetical protein
MHSTCRHEDSASRRNGRTCGGEDLDLRERLLIRRFVWRRYILIASSATAAQDQQPQGGQCCENLVAGREACFRGIGCQYRRIVCRDWVLSCARYHKVPHGRDRRYGLTFYALAPSVWSPGWITRGPRLRRESPLRLTPESHR